MRTAQVGGRRLAYDESGSPSAPTVLLLPWMGGSRLGWTEVATALSDTYRVIVPDYRDTGDSARSEDAYTLPDLADDAADFLMALDAAPAAVVGLSLGGMVAQHLRIRHPERVRALALVSTTPGGAASPPATERGRAALFLTAELEAGERARQAMTLMTAPGFTDAHPQALDFAERNARQHPMSADSYRRQFRAVRSHDVTERLGSIHVPTLVLHGADDDLIPLPAAEHLAAGIPGAGLKVYPNTGHMPQLEQAEPFLADLCGFLRSVSSF